MRSEEERNGGLGNKVKLVDPDNGTAQVRSGASLAAFAQTLVQRGMRKNITQFALVIELIVIFMLFEILTDGLFLTSGNLTNLLMQGCTFAIIAIGMVFVMVAGSIDLSAGSVLGFLAVFAATLETKTGVGAIAAIALTIVAGFLIGCWHGYWIAYRKVPSFIATLAGMLIFRGLTLWLGGGATVGPMSSNFSILGSSELPKIFFKDAAFNDTSGVLTVVTIIIVVVISLRLRASKASFGFAVRRPWVEASRLVAISATIGIIASVMIFSQGIPYAVVLLLALAVLYTFISSNTAFGRSVYAIGGNAEASRFSGINIELVTFKIFASMGVVVGIASVVFLGRVGSATALSGQNFEFNAITGCIVGGTSTLGGAGTIVGAVIGTFLMAGLDNGMSLLDLGTTYQYIAKGLVLLAAVAFDVASKKDR